MKKITGDMKPKERKSIEKLKAMYALPEKNARKKRTAKEIEAELEARAAEHTKGV